MSGDPVAQTSQSTIDSKDLRSSLNMVILAVCFGTVFFTVSQGPALTGFARKLGANDFVFGLLMALPVLGGIAQVFASYLLERHGTRRSFLLSALYPQRLIWIPLAFIPFLIPETSITERISIAIALIFLSNLCGSVGNVAFMSWMSDLVPRQTRGSFFGTRSSISTVVATVAAWSVGWFLDLYTNYTGYMIVFIAAALFGATDIFFFHFIKEPPMERDIDPPKLSKVFTEPFTSKPFRRFVTFWCSAMFSFLLLGPFTTVYLLEVLSLGFKSVSLYVQVIPNIAIFFASRQWGKMIDSHGCKPVLTVAMMVQIAIPFLWFFTTANRWWLLVLVNFLGGFFWSAMDLGSVNMLMRITPDKNRSAYVANYALLTGIVGNALSYIVAGTFLSQIRPIVDSLNITVMGTGLTRFHFLFLLSGLIRLLIFIFLVPRIEDPGSLSAKELLGSIFIKIHPRNIRTMISTMTVQFNRWVR